MKKPPKPKPSQNPSTEIPANLRRKAVAPRPYLGHVIPEGSVTTRRPNSSSGGSSNSPKLRPQGQARVKEQYGNPSNLIILGGTCRGRKIRSPETVYLRPMMGKVREAVYSSMRSFGLYTPEMPVYRHLDIFAGSGSVGLESLSRGAQHCTFVDLSEDCCQTVEENLKSLGYDDYNHDSIEKNKVVCSDFLAALRDPYNVLNVAENTKYNVVTICPPYEEIVYGDLLQALSTCPVLADDAIVMIEYPVELNCLPHVIVSNEDVENKKTLIGLRNRKYGRTVIAMYIVNPTGTLDGAESRPEEFVSLR
eukprot:CAMPEP_0197824380 /NCGR_PEP_ID=MMETSP1437-20131217/1635_1 /TAXON_ID=49252 ORGANISM="Eucampia antarctica, Strain CCMP1452" /NCGR_SAMPLE_ID=MMETSP1437 /ASSEMBLY_ACC=CAM_ASM_001096 /LENGTH=306 /DNA_ID=CAMNT_0043423983 /DNA_START=277 /DNA_END=1197 /DNA_ORIENTATION=+